MAGHGHHAHLDRDVTRLKPGAKTLGLGLIGAGLVAIIAAAVAALAHEEHVVGNAGAASSWQRFWFAYMTGFSAVCALSCAGVIFMLIAHLVRSGWVTNIRRLQETVALNIVVCFVLVLPIIIVTLGQKGTIYSWAVPADTKVVHHGGTHDQHNDPNVSHSSGTAPDVNAGHAKEAHASKPSLDNSSADKNYTHHRASESTELGGRQTEHAGNLTTGDPHYFDQHQVAPGVKREFDHIIAEKRHLWLNPYFWAFRVIVYFGILSAIAMYVYRHGVQQDRDSDVDHTYKNMSLAAPALVIAALAVTFIGVDVFMTLDPHWFSTMFGVYFFASGAQAFWAVIALSVLALQARGYLRESVTVDNRQDIGKFMFAFVVFFAYIAYSQYMLQWYANLPEETFWFDKRGYSTANPNGYSPLPIILLIGRFVIPFLGFVSRWVKRSRFGLAFWSVWLLAMFAVDMYHIIQPELSSKPLFGIVEILGFIGVVVLWVGNYIRQLATQHLRQVHDPRAEEAVAIHNI